jgi:hypothetical protein
MFTDSSAALEIVLSGAKATNDCPVTGGYSEHTFKRRRKVPIVSKTNGVTAVVLMTALAAPATAKSIDNLRVVNSDTAAVTLTLRYNQSGTFTTAFKVTLAVGDQLVYDREEGFKVLDANGNEKSITSAIAAASASAPATAGAAGVAGQIAYDATHIYVCIAANTWCRATIATW